MVRAAGNPDGAIGLLIALTLCPLALAAERQTAAPRLVDAPAPTAVKLPAAVDAAIAGAGGKIIVLHLKKWQQLALFDVAQGKVVKYLRMPGNDLAIAPGAEKLFVGIKDRREIQRWDLGKLELETTVPAPEGGIGLMAIGADAAGPVVLVSEQSAKRFWQIDPKTMRAEKYPSAHWGSGANSGSWGPSHIAVSFDGTVSLACEGGWAGVEVATVIGGRIANRRVIPQRDGRVMPAGDGQLLFTGGGVFRSDMTPVPGITGMPFPAVDSSFSVALEDRPGAPRSLVVFSNSDPRPLVSIRGLTELARQSAMPVWQRVHLIPRHNVLITTDEGAEHLLVRKFELEDELARSGIDFLFVQSTPRLIAERGGTYCYPVKVRARKPARMDLQGGPPGMTLGADGTLTWPVPADFKEATATVMIRIVDSSGQTIYHSFMIKIV